MPGCNIYILSGMRRGNRKIGWYDVTAGESPESLVIPYEDINERQKRISGESFPDCLLELCDHCRWSCSCFNLRGKIEKCPLCGHKLSEVPMTLEEVSKIDYRVGRPGMTIIFGRRPPFR